MPKRTTIAASRSTRSDAHEEALASFAEALAIRPDYAEALNNRGTALAELDRPDDALASYDAALALDPDYVECHWNRGPGAAAAGRVRAGLGGLRVAAREGRLGAARLSRPGVGRRRRRPAGACFSMPSRRSATRIQFARFARTVAAAGIDVDARGAAAAGAAPAIARRRDRCRQGAPLPAFDCHLPLMSVPHVLRLPSVAADGALSRGRAGADRALASALAGGGLPGRDRLAGQSEGAGSQPLDPAARLPAAVARARRAAHQPAEERRRRAARRPAATA